MRRKKIIDESEDDIDNYNDAYEDDDGEYKIAIDEDEDEEY